MRTDPRLVSLVGEIGNFSRLHKVQDKETKKEIPFLPMPMQDKIFAAVEAGHNRIAIAKARQTTATTGAKMVLHHMAYTTPHAAMHAIVSMRSDSATSLMDDHRRWLTHLPDLLQRPLRTHSRGTITYDDTGAGLKAFTSRSTTGLRSFTPSAVLISEFAFAPDQAEVLAQADAAVGKGLLLIESTANNPGDLFSKIIQEGEEGGWHVITMWWWEHPAYRTEDDLIPEDFTLTEGEKQLQERHNLDVAQLHWRRQKLSELKSEAKFRREYPASLDDCFLSREGGYFGEEELSRIQVLEFAAGQESGVREIEAPKHHDRYTMGVDVGGGVQGDWSTLAVVSVATRQPVYLARSRSLSPAAWAHKVIQVGTRYMDAFVLAESNNHGHALIQELDQCGYRNQWRNPTSGKPWVTTLKSKLEAFDCLREALELVQIMDRITWMELRALTIPAGKVCPEAPKGFHDDSAVAIALAYRALSDAPSAWRTLSQASNRHRTEDLITAARARRIRTSGLPF